MQIENGSPSLQILADAGEVGWLGGYLEHVLIRGEVGGPSL